MDGEQHPTEKLGRNPKTEQKSGFLSKLKPSAILAWFRGTSRNTKLIMSLALVLLIVGVFAIIFSSNQETSNEFATEETIEEITDEIEKIGAVVSLQEGTLQTKDENDEWIDVVSEFQPEEGTQLRTVGAASRSVISFDDGSALRLDANSEVEFVTLTVERIVVKHVDGYTYSRILYSEERSYVVESEDAQYEALGTAFKTAATGDEQAVEVYHSTVHETVTNQKPIQGEKLTVKSVSDPSKDGTIEKLDVEIVKQDKFMQWNKELDQQDDNFKNSLGFLGDFDGPELKVTSHTEGDTVLLDPSATEGTIVFKGTTEKRSTMTIQSKSQTGSSPVNITVKDDGSFESPVLTAPLGDSVFEFIVKDWRGNKTELTMRLNFQRKSQPVTNTQGGILLTTLLQNGTNVDAVWSLLGGLETPDGVKIVWSEDKAGVPTPTYGDSLGSVWIETGTNTSISIDGGSTIESGKKYKFSVCLYDKTEDTCTKYSPVESIDIP